MDEPKPDWSQLETQVGNQTAVRSPSASSSPGLAAQFLTIGTVLADRYDITATLGEGGMGAVYKAHDRELDRDVAVKTIHPELAGNSEMLRRFKQELILARQIAHRNIVRLYDIAESSGVKFLTMEFIDGEDFRTILRREGKMSPRAAVAVIRQICLALEAAHAEGVIHRDLKPQNIMRDKSGRIVVMDFGLARALESGGMTQSGAMVGTMEYMSPEQAKGQAVGPTSDIYAAGLIFYELLTGKMPYQADSALASLMKRSQERAIPASEIDKSIPRPLSSIVSHCIEPDHQKRYQSAAELLADLEAYQPSSSRPATSVIIVRPQNGSRWYQWVAVALVAIALAGVGFLGWMKFASRTPVQHAPVSVLVADFTNHTGDPIFDDTLEPMFNAALEGASFINGFDRGVAHKLAQKLPHPTDQLDEQPARLVAVSQAVSAVITGEISRRGDDYRITVEALDARTGNTIGHAEITAANKDEVLLDIPKLAAPIRKALGDNTPESVQLEEAGGAFTTSSLEAVHQYGVGMQDQFAGNFEGAVEAFSKAVQIDPNFARAYAGMAGQAANMGKLKDAERYIKLAMEHVDRMTERERYRIRGSYYLNAGDWQKCVDEYGELVAKYPGDNIGHTNLAGCYMELRNGRKAVEQAREAVKIIPNGAVQRLNLSFFSSFSGDFEGGEREARAALQINPSSALGYLVLAEAQLGSGNIAQANQTYQELEKLSPLGATFAASGLGDLALYEGKFADAVRIFEQGAASDLAAKNPDNAANKFVALARAELLRGNEPAAVTAADKALAQSQGAKIRFLAGLTFVDAGEPAKAQKLAGSLEAELQGEPQAYGKIVEGMLALKRGEAQLAIKSLTEANGVLDTWIGHFELGRAYLQAGLFVDADSEFDRCLKRRGEALELFLDNAPTYSYIPDVYYYIGQVRAGLKSPGFADAFRTYLSLRGQAGEDPRLPGIRRSLGQ